MEVTPEVLAAKFGAIFPHLDERQRRLLMGADALALGHGGIRLVARAARVREATVPAGAGELEVGAGPLGRVRRPAAGGRRPPRQIPGWCPRCCRWWNRTSAGTRPPRCGGRLRRTP
jgi:hypothetical protein